ncbi:S41 family peptidase [Rhizobium sp.]|uniref:S41 family peptidase n=1 Tax=Rhizobium sp. TaxID=391 RepID=UPI002AA8113F
MRDPDIVERAHIAAKAYHTIRRYFAHAEGLPAEYDFEARYRAYLQAAISAEDRRAFSLASMRLFASLRNGHTSFVDDQLREEMGPRPFMIRLIEGQWTVVWTRITALSPGDVIAGIDGKSVAEWFDPVYDYIGKSHSVVLDFSLWRFADVLPKVFTLRMDDGRQILIDLTAATDGQAHGRFPANDVDIIRRDDGLVVIKVPAFDDPKYEQSAISAIRDATDAKAVLLDLRGNRGGSTPVNLLAAIMMTPYQGTMFTSPMTIACNDAAGSHESSGPDFTHLAMRYGPYTIQPLPNAWKGKIAVLADNYCGSAGEDFVLRFQQGGRGLVLGETTWGSTGQPYFVGFPEFGMSFRVSTKREYFANGTPFEGVGVTPDRVIPLTREELRSGVDAQLEEAAKIALML